MELFSAQILVQLEDPLSQTRTAKRCVAFTSEANDLYIIFPQIHYITDNIRCCGAGTAADTEFTTALIASNMELHQLSTGRKPRVVTAMTMLKQRLFQCALRIHHHFAKQ